jgi:phosphatidate cytidylyltransferase
MTNSLKRAIFGTIYIVVMWTGSYYSNESRFILFVSLTLISIYEILKIRLGKSKVFHILYVCTIMSWYLIELKILLFVFILTWIFDTFAYLVGTKFGKHKIIPNISPNKSWEGFTGGLIISVIISFVLFNLDFFSNETNSIILIIIGFILPFTATIGDLIVSKFKRQAGVKDTGTIIPGHGGILDRIDALMITIPIVLILRIIF